MWVTIVKSDNQVSIDGQPQEVDCSQLPRYLHAIQWYDDHGEIEFITDPDGHRMPNIKIVDFTPFQFLIDAYNRKKDEVKKALEKRQQNPETTVS